MGRVLVTGMSGVGKSSVLSVLDQRGFSVLDTDQPGWTKWSDAAGGYVWEEDRISKLLAGESGSPQFVSGAVSNQRKFYDHFRAVILLSAPVAVLLERVVRRDTNDFGKTAPQRSQILRDLAEIEPLMRRTCTVEIDATQPLKRVVDQVAQLFDELRP